jgi:hypothetical protein
LTRFPAALSLLAALYAGTALAETPSSGDRTSWTRISCSQYGSLVYSDEKATDDASATSDWREKVSRSFPKAICVSARRVGGTDPKYKQFGALPDVMPAPEPPPEPVVVAHTAQKASAGPASAPQAPIPVQTLGTPGAPVDDAALKAALSAIGLQRGQPASRQAPVQARPAEPKPEPVAAPTVPTPMPAGTAAAPAPAVETVAFADGQDYATGGFIVSDQPVHERRDGGRRTVLAGMVFAEPGQASGYADPGMTTGGVMVAEAEPETRVSQVAAAAVLPEPPAASTETAPPQSFVVQLASFAGWERGRMQGVWRQLSGKATALAGLEPRIVKVGGQKTYTALRVGPLDETSAKDLARSLGDKGIEARMFASSIPGVVAMAMPADQ